MNGNRLLLAVDALGLAILCFLTAAYFLFGVPFAELHIEFFNAFPVFIGEIGLAICLLLFVCRCVMDGPTVKSSYIWLWVIYGSWILLKAVAGYFVSGGYALRNSALFYYPFTAFFVHVFSRNFFVHSWDLRRVLTDPRLSAFFTVIGILVAFAQAAVSMEPFARYCLLACLAGAFLLINSRPWTLVGLLAVLLGGVMTGLWDCYSRTHLVSLLSAGIFLLAYFFITWDMSARYKLAFGLLSCALLVMFIVVRSDPHAVKSLVTPGQLFKVYQGFQEKLQREGLFYVPQTKEARVYNPAPADLFSQVRLAEMERRDKWPASSGDEQEAARRSPRPIDTAYNNILFRYFIWRDMAEEFLRERPVLFGFSFGKPQRSRSLEILGWAWGEWSRDGWIAPHNSYLHLIYRGGMVGLGLIVVTLLLLVRMVSAFATARSATGAFLASTLVFGLVTANFLVFLELPYTAVPFWFLFGLTWVYSRAVRKEHRSTAV